MKEEKVKSENSNKSLSIEERFNQLIKKDENSISEDIYGDPEEEVEIQRIEEAFKAFKKKSIFDTTNSNPWNYTKSGWLSKKLVSKHLNSVKTGLNSIYPIPCKKDQCPYGDSCIALQNNLEPPYGEPCVMETYKIEQLLIGYARDFDIDSASATDQILIKELVQLDLLMDRCQILMAKEGDVLQNVNMGVTDDGEVYTQPVVSRYLDAYERCSKRRQSLLNEMLGTRHSRKGLKEVPINEDELLLKVINSVDDFDKVEERPDKFKENEN